jgi:hypothetical protein
MLLALASVVFLRSESLVTRDHILLSQIWNFPFRRLLRLAGSRWRHSTPLPYGCTTDLILFCTYIISRRAYTKHIRCPAICEPHRKHLFLYCCIYSALHSNGNYPIVAVVFVAVLMCLPSRYLATALHVTIRFHQLKNKLTLQNLLLFLVFQSTCNN